jgi:hypothetical protein
MPARIVIVELNSSQKPKQPKQPKRSAWKESPEFQEFVRCGRNPKTKREFDCLCYVYGYSNTLPKMSMTQAWAYGNDRDRQTMFKTFKEGFKVVAEKTNDDIAERVFIDLRNYLYWSFAS